MGIGHIHAHCLADVESLPSVNFLVEVEVEQEADLNTGQLSSLCFRESDIDATFPLFIRVSKGTG